MSVTVVSLFYETCHLTSQLYETNIIIIPILHLVKLRHKTLYNFPKVTQILVTDAGYKLRAPMLTHNTDYFLKVFEIDGDSVRGE